VVLLWLIISNINNELKASAQFWSGKIFLIHLESSFTFQGWETMCMRRNWLKIEGLENRINNFKWRQMHWRILKNVQKYHILFLRFTLSICVNNYVKISCFQIYKINFQYTLFLNIKQSVWVIAIDLFYFSMFVYSSGAQLKSHGGQKNFNTIFRAKFDVFECKISYNTQLNIW